MVGFDLAPVLTIIGAAGALAGSAVIYGGTVFYDQHRMKQEFNQRADRLLEDNVLTSRHLEEFTRGNPACGKDRPYGAAFTAKAADGSFVQGTICTSRTRESKIVYAPK